MDLVSHAKVDPFHGSRLFGKDLKPLLMETKGKTKMLLTKLKALRLCYR